MSIGLIRRFLGPTKNNEKNQENQPTTVKILYLGHKMYVGLIRRFLGPTKNNEKKTRKTNQQL